MGRPTPNVRGQHARIYYHGVAKICLIPFWEGFGSLHPCTQQEREGQMLWLRLVHRGWPIVFNFILADILVLLQSKHFGQFSILLFHIRFFFPEKYKQNLKNTFLKKKTKTKNTYLKKEVGHTLVN